MQTKAGQRMASLPLPSAMARARSHFVEPDTPAPRVVRARTLTDDSSDVPPPSPRAVRVPNTNTNTNAYTTTCAPTPTLLGRVGRAVTMDISEMPSRRTAQALFMQGYQPRNVVLVHVADTSSSLAMRRGLSFNRRPVAVSVASDLSMDLGTSAASSGGSAMSISPPPRSSMQLCAKNVLGGVDLGAAERSTGVGGRGGLASTAPLRIRKVLKQEVGECPASPSFRGGNPWGAKDKSASPSGLTHQEFLGSLAVAMSS